jgi:hypothetical protein
VPVVSRPSTLPHAVRERTIRRVTELDEWDALVSEALEIRETAEDKQRRLRHLERDVLLADLTLEESESLLNRVYAAARGVVSARD